MEVCTKMYIPMSLAPLHARNDVHVKKPALELKVLPPHLRYAFLDDASSSHVIISFETNVAGRKVFASAEGEKVYYWLVY